MSNLNNTVDTFNNKVKGWLSFLDSNEYVNAALIIFLIVYASYAAPKLPPYILKLFDNPLFKLLIFFLIAYSAKKNPTVAIIAAVALMVSIHALNKLKFDRAMISMVHKHKMQPAMKMSMQHQQQEFVQPYELPQEEHMSDQAESEMMMNEIARNEMRVPHEAVADLEDETKSQPCDRMANFRNSFYPQYVHNNPSAYEARYGGQDVNGYDPRARYSST